MFLSWNDNLQKCILEKFQTNDINFFHASLVQSSFATWTLIFKPVYWVDIGSVNDSCREAQFGARSLESGDVKEIMFRKSPPPGFKCFGGKWLRILISLKVSTRQAWSRGFRPSWALSLSSDTNQLVLIAHHYLIKSLSSVIWGRRREDREVREDHVFESLPVPEVEQEGGRFRGGQRTGARTKQWQWKRTSREWKRALRSRDGGFLAGVGGI